MTTAYLGLGSSLGDRKGNLRQAVNRLDTHTKGVCVEKVSSIYESPHLGVHPADARALPPHLNIAIQICTDLCPETLLMEIRLIEDAGGRTRMERWAPRTIDIDILLYDNICMKTESLILPHPELERRAFVVAPLYELAPQLVLPDGRAIATLLQSHVIAAQELERVGAADELFL